MNRSHNYLDYANFNEERHRSNLNETKKNTAKWKDRVFEHEMTTMQAVDLFQNESLDFIYIDARHDYKAVWDDLEAWFPKLRKGGLFSGHDYVDADYYHLVKQGQNWSVSADGTNNGKKAVASAVNEFAVEIGVRVQTTKSLWFDSWYFLKPC